MKEPVPFLDLVVLHAELREELDEVWHHVVDTAAFVGGAFVETFEQDFASYCSRRHAIGVANGTDAIELVLRALAVGPGDEVIVPTNTFYATAEAVLAVGATPIFVDVDPHTLLATPDLVEQAIGPRTAAMIPVHLFGQTVDLDSFEELSRRTGVPMIEDAAQAHGATWNGRRAGSVGVAGCFSFYPGKNLGAVGDGGAVVTDDARLADTIRSLANHGRDATVPSGHGRVGRNSRLDGLQAGVLARKLPRLDGWNEQRRSLWKIYEQGFEATPVRPIGVADGATSVHHLAVVRVPERDRLRESLAAEGIGTGIHYPVPCHQLPPFDTSARGIHPIAESAASEILSLPMYPQLDPADARRVVDAVLSALDTDDTSARVGASAHG
jgi:dTDP-4-amino-4,6-dideoxygalactose transaminase